MNKKRFFFSFTVLLLLVAACSKDKAPANLPEGETNISAQIGDDRWEAVEYESAVNVIPDKGQFFELTSFNNKYKLELSVLEFEKSTGTISEGTYNDDIFFSVFMSDEEGNFSIEYKPAEINEDVEAPLTITITASSNRTISGTFSGKVYKVSHENEAVYPEMLLITNGIFNNLPFEAHTVNIQ